MIKRVDVEDLTESDQAFYDVIDRVTVGDTYELYFGDTHVATLVPVEDYDQMVLSRMDQSDPTVKIMGLGRDWISMDGSLMEDDRKELLKDFDAIRRRYFTILSESDDDV